MKLFLYTVNIQYEITDNNAVFSQDCKGSVWKSWEGGDSIDNVYVQLSGKTVCGLRY